MHLPPPQDINRAVLTTGHFLHTEKDDPNRGHFGKVVFEFLQAGILKRKDLVSAGMTKNQVECAEAGAATGVADEIQLRVILLGSKRAMHLIDLLEEKSISQVNDIDWAMEV